MLVDLVTVKGEKVSINIFKILFLVKNEKKNTVTVWLDSGDYFDIPIEESNKLKFFCSDVPFVDVLRNKI